MGLCYISVRKMESDHEKSWKLTWRLLPAKLELRFGYYHWWLDLSISIEVRTEKSMNFHETFKFSGNAIFIANRWFHNFFNPNPKICFVTLTVDTDTISVNDSVTIVLIDWETFVSSVWNSVVRSNSSNLREQITFRLNFQRNFCTWNCYYSFKS